jgi:hypothetical protein
MNSQNAAGDARTIPTARSTAAMGLSRAPRNSKTWPENIAYFRSSRRLGRLAGEPGDATPGEIRHVREMGLVSRASPVQTAVRNCTGDEGRPFEVGNQVLILSHRKLLLSKQWW